MRLSGQLEVVIVTGDVGPGAEVSRRREDDGSQLPAVKLIFKLALSNFYKACRQEWEGLFSNWISYVNVSVEKPPSEQI